MICTDVTELKWLLLLRTYFLPHWASCVVPLESANAQSLIYQQAQQAFVYIKVAVTHTFIDKTGLPTPDLS